MSYSLDLKQVAEIETEKRRFTMKDVQLVVKL